MKNGVIRHRDIVGDSECKCMYVCVCGEWVDTMMSDVKLLMGHRVYMV